MTEKAGVTLARGVSRYLRSLGFQTLTEFTPTKRLRVDVIALSPKGVIWVVECKSSRADFTSDHKWEGYLPYCDRFFWAVPTDFPLEVLPEETGILLADGYFAHENRESPESKLSAARRKSLIQKIALAALERLNRHTDPESYL